MGALHYGGTSLEFEDRLLSHLQIVVVQKFRRGESFLMSWLQGDAQTMTRRSLWMTPGTVVFFHFNGSRTPAIDEDWLKRLAASAESSMGLVVASADGKPVHLPVSRPARARLYAS